MIELSRRTVTDVLITGAGAWPERVAVVDERDRATYSELFDRSCRVAGGLRALGIGRGDTVALILDNSVDHVLAWFGCSLLRAVEVAVNTAFMAPQLAYVVGHCEARVVVVDECYLDRLREVAGQLSDVRAVVVRGDPSAADDLPFEVVGWDELAVSNAIRPEPANPADPLGIVYTSGTTAMPKGVLVSQAQTYGRMWPLGPATAGHDDVTLVVLPIYHVIGQCRGLYNSVIAGGTAVLERRFSASRFWDVCRLYQATYVPLVGAMAQYLLRQPERPDDADTTVTHVSLGTTIPEVDTFRRRFGLERVSVSYGLTEVGGVLVGDATTAGCGRLRPDFEALLVGEDDVAVADGEMGELVLRSTEPWTTMLGYFKNHEATVEKWRNLWLHTGDLMVRDADETYRFVGRRSERIRVRGENVAPGEVEAQLASHPAVAECAVVGMAASGDGAVGDQEILVAVVLASGAFASPDQLVVHLERRLPRFAVPRYVAFVTSLPRTEATQRVQRARVAEAALGRMWDRLAPNATKDSGHRGGAADGDPGGTR